MSLQPFKKVLNILQHYPTKKKFLILAELRKNLFKRSFLTKNGCTCIWPSFKKILCIDFIFRIFSSRICYSLFSAANRNSINKSKKNENNKLVSNAV